MFKIVALLAFATIASAGILPATHVVHHEPVLAKVGTVVHSAPSAVSHQSITQVHHHKSIVQPVLAPVHTVHSVPHVVHSVHSVPVVHAAPVHAVHSVPVVHAASVHSVPVLHAAPVVKTILH